METDFIGFSYGKTHLLRDLNIYRTSDGSRYNTNLIPSLTDKSADIPGSDGQFYFNSYHKNRQISVNFAFEELSESGLRALRALFNGKEVRELIFDEQPYKAYDAKVTSTPTIKALCFDKDDGSRVYRGEGTVQFTCFYPYAHTPNWVWTSDDGKTYSWTVADGRLINSYGDKAYPTKDQWNAGAGLTNSTATNLGDIEAPFIVTGASGTTTVAGKSIIIDSGSGTWNSLTGLVTNGGQAISARGDLCARIPVGGTASSSRGTLDYEYWYY